jgi:hypothetical protein
LIGPGFNVQGWPIKLISINYLDRQLVEYILIVYIFNFGGINEDSKIV